MNIEQVSAGRAMAEELQKTVVGDKELVLLDPAQDLSMLPAVPGTYVLVLRSAVARTVAIGRLGTLPLRPDWYLYVGSAFGPGGLLARVQHHSRRPTGISTHLDALPSRHRCEKLLCNLPERQFREPEQVGYADAIRTSEPWQWDSRAGEPAAGGGNREDSTRIGNPASRTT